MTSASTYGTKISRRGRRRVPRIAAALSSRSDARSRAGPARGATTHAIEERCCRSRAGRRGRRSARARNCRVPMNRSSGPSIDYRNAQQAVDGGRPPPGHGRITKPRKSDEGGPAKRAISRRVRSSRRRRAGPLRLVRGDRRRPPRRDVGHSLIASGEAGRRLGTTSLESRATARRILQAPDDILGGAGAAEDG